MFLSCQRCISSAFFLLFCNYNLLMQKDMHIPRGPKGCSATTKGNQEGTNGGTLVPFSAALRDCYLPFTTTNGYQEVTTIGSEVHSSSSATNEGAENIGEADYGSKVAISNLAGDFCWPIGAANDEEENIGEVAYDSILNLESPDPTTLLRIMMGNKYSTDKVSEQFQNVARLQAPNFATLLTVMNNAGYGEVTDDGHYDVDKVLTKLEGW